MKEIYWKDMASAPKDGTEILVFDYIGKQIVRWEKKENNDGGWHDQDGYYIVPESTGPNGEPEWPFEGWLEIPDTRRCAPPICFRGK